eukprot:8399586-Alexandrium_andersonii.AAC.1
MSASLVGSEMCIRDSACAARTQVLAQRKASIPLEMLSREWERERERESAVSYTHLTLPTICSV